MFPPLSQGSHWWRVRRHQQERSGTGAGGICAGAEKNRQRLGCRLLIEPGARDRGACGGGAADVRVLYVEGRWREGFRRDIARGRMNDLIGRCCTPRSMRLRPRRGAARQRLCLRSATGSRGPVCDPCRSACAGLAASLPSEAGEMRQLARGWWRRKRVRGLVEFTARRRAAEVLVEGRRFAWRGGVRSTTISCAGKRCRCGCDDSLSGFLSCGRRCVVVGAGPVAEKRSKGCCAPERACEWCAGTTGRIRDSRSGKNFAGTSARFRDPSLRSSLIVAATSSPSLLATIYRQARRRGVLCNVVDHPDHCDFYYGSVVRRGELEIAISTGGHIPRSRSDCARKWKRNSGGVQRVAERTGENSKRLFAKKITPERRLALLHGLASEASFEKFLGRKQRKSHV